MSRGFLGGGGKKTSSSSRGKGMMGKLTSFKKKRSLQEMVEDKTTHKVKTREDMIEDMFNEKMYGPRQNYSSGMMGAVAAEGKEMSKGRQKAMEIMMQKKMKKKINKRDKKVKIIPRPYGEGRLNASGKIMDKTGAIILEVNLETGIITNKMGLKVGKYDPNSQSNAFKIERLIQKNSTQNKVFNPFAPKT